MILERCWVSSEEGGDMALFCGKHITFSEKSDVRADMEEWAGSWRHVLLVVEGLNRHAYWEVKIQRAWRWCNSEKNYQLVLVGVIKKSRKKQVRRWTESQIVRETVLGYSTWHLFCRQGGMIEHLKSPIERFTGINSTESSLRVDLS